MRSFCFEIIYGILLIVQKGHSTPDGQRVALNGVQIITVWEWIRKKKLGAIKIGKEYRVSAEDIKAFERSRRTI